MCASSVLVSAFIARGGDELLQALDDSRYAQLLRNVETRLPLQALSEAWASKALQREFMTIVGMTS
jgi:hypothetical protein